MATTSAALGRGLGLVLVEFQYEYQGRDGSLISIKPNERYVLLAKTNDHWWQVRRDRASKPFYIPAKYVKELPLVFPSPLDFADPPPSEPAPVPAAVPVAVPVPVPVPVPKALEEPAGTRTKPADEVMIRLKPEASGGYRKTENRMSTFGFPLDSQEPSLLIAAGPRHPSIPLGPETGPETQSKKTLDDQRDSGKSQVPSFSLGDPSFPSRPHVQPIAVETPVVPKVDVQHAEDQEASMEEQEEEEEEEVVPEESNESESDEEDDPPKEGGSNHIYESIQDLNLDLATLTRPAESPGPPVPTKEASSPPIYAGVSAVKGSADTDPAPPELPDAPQSTTGQVPSPSATPVPDMTIPSPPVRTQDGWQVHTDQESGKVFYFHPVTLQTTWSDPREPCPPSPADSDPPGGLLSPPSPQQELWEQLLDQTSGRFYYYNPTSGATSWTAPPSLSPLSSTDDGPPPLPEEDYPVNAPDDIVFPTHLQKHVIPRAHLDLADGVRLPLRMRNGVEDRGWRHSVAEDMLVSRHLRNFSDTTDTRRDFPDSLQLSDRFSRRRNLSNRSTDSQQGHMLEKAGILNKTKVIDHGKKIRKNWSQSWTVLHGGILTFHRDPKSAPSGNMSKASQIVPEYTVELRGAWIGWASKDKSSKKNVLELRTRQGCEYLMQYDTESIITDWLKVIQDTVRQLEQEHLSDDEDDASSEREDKERKRMTTRSALAVDSEQTRVRTKLRRFLQRRPTLQSVKEKGYIRDNVFGCHLDTLWHRENATPPKFMEKCIRAVDRRGLHVDGIYRVSGNLAVIQKLRHKADHEEHLDLEDGQWEDIHVITGALKLFLRELPEPLFPFSFFDKFIAAIQVPDYDLRVSYMKDLVAALPVPNHDTMELLFKHLRRVIEHKESNRMSVQSVAIVFGPTLLRPQTESANMTIHMVFQSQIVELMLNEFHVVFVQS
ncbi:rho GTPase-activating protein 27-like isoform X2 [Entelurus aequoreus]|uniref:rho GTPase-activating protein 27-like isoform X2 n=1 Tax=Entelurus aequoreus TaxID=161455 RepID=UPI002B1CE352|nr:rho GTPase-activating protein 27-like isoform X2 [Entelurus aequoreus]